jgi:hypothetical protein
MLTLEKAVFWKGFSVLDAHLVANPIKRCSVSPPVDGQEVA